MTVYEIKPGVGVGPIKLGVSREEVHSLLGKPCKEGRTITYEFIG